MAGVGIRFMVWDLSQSTDVKSDKFTLGSECEVMAIVSDRQ